LQPARARSADRRRASRRGLAGPRFHFVRGGGDVFMRCEDDERIEVEQERPAPTDATRQPRQEAARRAMRALFPAGDPGPSVVPNKSLHRAVVKWLEWERQPLAALARDVEAPSLNTVLRAAGRK
jgi:hypothetical protein